MNFFYLSGLTALSSLISWSAFAGAEPWEFSCIYKDSYDGNTFEGGGDGLDGARQSAKDECHKGTKDLVNLWNDINTGWNRCSFVSCRTPLSCPPLDSSNLDLRLKGYKCEIDKINGQKSVAVNKINENVKQKAQEKYGAEAVYQLEAIRVTRFSNMVNATFADVFKTLSSEYSDLMIKFKNEYVPSYTKTTISLADWAKYSSTAPWPKLVGLKVDMEQVMLQESQAALNYEFAARLIQKKIDAQCNFFHTALKPYSAFLSEKNIASTGPDLLCVKARAKLEEIFSYTRNRRTQVLNAINELKIAIDKSIVILQNNEVDVQLRQSRSAVADLTSAGVYLRQVNRTIEQLWVEGNKDNQYNLPLESQKYARIKSFKIYIDECNKAATSLKWMGTGCIQVLKNVTTTQLYLTDTLPRNINLGLTFIEQAHPGIFSTQIQTIKNLLVAGNVQDAVSAYDFLLLKNTGNNQ